MLNIVAQKTKNVKLNGPCVKKKKKEKKKNEKTQHKHEGKNLSDVTPYLQSSFKYFLQSLTSFFVCFCLSFS